MGSIPYIFMIGTIVEFPGEHFPLLATKIFNCCSAKVSACTSHTYLSFFSMAINISLATASDDAGFWPVINSPSSLT